VQYLRHINLPQTHRTVDVAPCEEVHKDLGISQPHAGNATSPHRSCAGSVSGQLLEIVPEREMNQRGVCHSVADLQMIHFPLHVK
jgi:hypothetical protein